MLGRKNTAARTIHPQNHSLSVPVQPGLPNQPRSRIPTNRPRRLVTVQDLARGNDDANMLLTVGVELLLRMRNTHVVLLMNGLERPVLLVLAHEVDQPTL